MMSWVLWRRMSMMSRRCNPQSLLLLLVCVWLLCTFMILTENVLKENSVKIVYEHAFTVLPSGAISQTANKSNEICIENQFLESHMQALHRDRTGVSTVYVAWCKRNATFTLRHYLSLRSVLHFVNPDEIRFTYSHLPLEDESGYHQWLKKFGHEYPFLRVEPSTTICRGEVVAENWINERLSFRKGAMYMNIDVILTASAGAIMNSDHEAVKLVTSGGDIALFSMKRVFAKKMYVKNRTGFSYVVNKTAIDDLTKYNACDTVTELPDIEIQTPQMTSSPCIETGAWKDDLYPEHFKNCKSSFCEYVQRLLFRQNGVKCLETVSPSMSQTPSPNIVHYIHFGRFPLSFMFYMSILSYIHIQQVDRVYIHCDQEPRGDLWENLVKSEGHMLQVVHRSNPLIVFNQTINVVEHMADIAKADIAFKYGGILSDPDLVIVQKLKKEWFYMDAVVGLDIGDLTPFPDILNLGILICKPQNTFSRLWIESMREFNDSNWLWNSGKVTYKIVENDPTVAKVDPRLQVICYKYKCYPTWLPKHVYRNLDTAQETLTHSLRNWTHEAYSFHFTFPEPYVSEQYLLKQGGIAGDIGRHIYKSAGKIT